jgi:hypothetical protein
MAIESDPRPSTGARPHATGSASGAGRRGPRRFGVGSMLSALLPGLVSLAVVFAVAPTAMAEDGAAPEAGSVQAALDRQLAELPSGEEGVSRILGELTRRLELTETQQREIRPIVEQAVASMESSRDRYLAGDLSPLALGMQLQMAGQKAAVAVEPLLTPEQSIEYAQMRQEQRREMMKAMRRATSGAAAEAGAQ